MKEISFFSLSARRYIAAAVLLFVALLPAMAGNTNTYYYKATATASPSSSAGKVYISKTSTSNPNYNNNQPITGDGEGFDPWIGSTTYPETTIYLYAQPNSGYIFSGWSYNNTIVSENSNYSPTISFSGSSSKPKSFEFFAIFTEQTGLVRVEVAPGDIGKGGVTISNVANTLNSTVTITARPDVFNGVKFLGWTKDEGTEYVKTQLSETFTVTAETAGTYYAHFSPAEEIVFLRIKNNKTKNFLTLYGNAKPRDYTRNYTLSGHTERNIKDGFIFENSLQMISEDKALGNPMTVFQRNGFPIGTQGTTSLTGDADLVSFCDDAEINYLNLVDGSHESHTYELTMETDEDGVTRIYTDYTCVVNYNGTHYIPLRCYLCDGKGDGNEGWAVMKTLEDLSAQQADYAEWTIYLLDSDCMEGSFGAYAKEAYTLNGKYYTTMYTEFPYQVSDDVKAYYLPLSSDNYDEDAQTIKFSIIRNGKVPPRTPVVLECPSTYESTEYKLNRLIPIVKENVPDLQGNVLSGYTSYYNTNRNPKVNTVPNLKPDMFILSQVNGKLGWYYSKAENMTPNKAYLDLSRFNASPDDIDGLARTIRFKFGDDGESSEFTGVITPEYADDIEGPLFDLNGRRVTDGDAYGLKKGVYVTKGKKIIVK